MTDWKQVLAASGNGVRVRDDNRVDYLVNGAETYRAMYDAISTTFRRQSGFYIYLLAWWLDADLPLIAGDQQSTFLALVRRASTEFGVQVRVLLWLNRLASLWPFDPGAQGHLQDEIGKLPTGACLIDNVLPSPFYAHHQKVLIVRGAQGLVGFCGGLDIAHDRVEKVTFHTGSPFHDVHCRIEGDAANDLVDIFAQRWAAHPAAKGVDRTQGTLRGLTDRTPPGGKSKPAGNQSVGISRTYIAPRMSVPPSDPQAWCSEELSIWPVISAAIANARRFIYLEDQYLVGMAAAEAIAAVLPRLQHVTIMIPAVTDLPYNDIARAKFVYRLWQDKSQASKVRVFHRPPGPSSYIHAKTWIIDDELALIGSANVNRRGWSGDNEAMAAIYDTPTGGTGPSPASATNPPFAQRLRMRLWSEHLGVDPNSLRDGTNPTPWVAAAKNYKVVTYIPFLEASKEDAARFPDPGARVTNVAVLAAMDVAGYKGPSNVKAVWDNLLDPRETPAASCRRDGAPRPRR